jgi:hypothetical protein
MPSRIDVALTAATSPDARPDVASASRMHALISV